MLNELNVIDIWHIHSVLQSWIFSCWSMIFWSEKPLLTNASFFFPMVTTLCEVEFSICKLMCTWFPLSENNYYPAIIFQSQTILTSAMVLTSITQADLLRNHGLILVQRLSHSCFYHELYSPTLFSAYNHFYQKGGLYLWPPNHTYTHTHTHTHACVCICVCVHVCKHIILKVT